MCGCCNGVGHSLLFGLIDQALNSLDPLRRFQAWIWYTVAPRSESSAVGPSGHMSQWGVSTGSPEANCWQCQIGWLWMTISNSVYPRLKTCVLYVGISNASLEAKDECLISQHYKSLFMNEQTHKTVCTNMCAGVNLEVFQLRDFALTSNPSDRRKRVECPSVQPLSFICMFRLSCCNVVFSFLRLSSSNITEK